MSLNSTPCDDHLFAVIADAITHDSLLSFTICLKVSRVDFTQIEKTHRGNHKDQVIEILYKWKTENGEGATYSALIQVYKQMKNQEAVELIEGHYKKNHSSNPPLASGTDLKLPISKGISSIQCTENEGNKFQHPVQETKNASEVPQSNDTDGSNPVASLEKDAKAPKWNEELSKETRKEEQFSSELVKDIKVLLMTATKIEDDGVKNYLEPIKDRGDIIETCIDYTGIVLLIGKYGNNPVIFAKSAESRRFQGSTHAAIVLSIILRECKDIKYVISVGVCFGIKVDQKFAYINISDLVDDQTIERVGTNRDNTFPQGAQPPVSRDMLEKFETKEKFSLPTDPEYSVEVKKGPFISANKLVNSSAEKAKMKDNRRDAIAGEMEGAGIMTAIEYAKDVKAIIIKAIGDWGDDKKGESSDWKPIAAYASAYYVKEMLSKETFN